MLRTRRARIEPAPTAGEFVVSFADASFILSEAEFVDFARAVIDRFQAHVLEAGRPIGRCPQCGRASLCDVTRDSSASDNGVMPDHDGQRADGRKF